jgi:hypothetical protein
VEDVPEGMVRHDDPCAKCAARGIVCFGPEMKACETCTGLKIGCNKAGRGKGKTAVVADERKGKGKSKAPGKC